MPEETTTTTATAPEVPETTAPEADEAPPVIEATIEDTVDHESLQRRFGLKPPEPSEELAEDEPEPDEGEPPVEEPTEEPEPPAPSPTIKAKVDGQVIEVDVQKTFPEFAEAWDKFTDSQKQRILAMHQKDLSASRRFEQANLTRKQMMALVEGLKNNPMGVLGHPSLNHNVRQIVEEWLIKKIEFDEMDPQAKELHETKEKLKSREEQERATKKQAEQVQMDTMMDQQGKQYQTEIIDAMEKSSLPKTTETVRRIAHYLREALKPRGGKPGVKLKAIDVVDLVREDYERVMKNMIGHADPEELVKMFGDGFTEKMRKHMLKPLRKAGQTPPVQPPAGNKRKVTKKMTKEEWRAMINRRAQ